ncbi:hypothetical protein [Methylobacterium oryzae]|uniref:hypothetical protein n=1 Tax=Methylobacterium oryzae TaxID=334852 RepID=UPI001F314F0E|nr:hypothetical protein [Methylobacterium oryzae]UIN38279.1 hypothetical protein LXM90_31080 [Methylobacterium oryzae]
MKNLPAGCAFSVTVPFQNAQGVAVQPTGIIVTVLNEDGKVLHGPEIPDASVLEQDAITYKVPASVNALPVDVPLAVRVVEVELTTADGVIELRESVLLRAGLRLRYLVNSFGTYERLVMAAADMPRIESFNALEQTDQEPALIEAFRRLTRFGYRVLPPGYDDGCDRSFNTIGGVIDRIVPREWQAMTPEWFETLNPDFRSALLRAQVQEANAILTSGTADEARSQGLLSKTTGESSAMFRSGKPLELGISKETLAHLTGFIEIRSRLARA